MIFDRIERLTDYHPAFAAARAFLATCGPETPDGVYPLDEAGLYAKVDSYSTRLPEGGNIESHRKYIDIQSCLVGAEGIEFFRMADVELAREDEAKDFLLYRPGARPAGKVDVFPGDCVVLFPQDPHRPQMTTGRGVEAIRKVVVKVPVTCLK